MENIEIKKRRIQRKQKSEIDIFHVFVFLFDCSEFVYVLCPRGFIACRVYKKYSIYAWFVIFGHMHIYVRI